MKPVSSVPSAGLSSMQYSEMKQRIDLEITVVSKHLYTNYSFYSTYLRTHYLFLFFV